MLWLVSFLCGLRFFERAEREDDPHELGATPFRFTCRALLHESEEKELLAGGSK
jgi:hypothetical protein